MAKDPRYPDRGGDFQESLARMKAQNAASENLIKKNAEIAASEDRGISATQRNIAARLDAAEAINAQAGATERLVGRLGQETGALGANAAAWERAALAIDAAASASARFGGGGIGPGRSLQALPRGREQLLLEERVQIPRGRAAESLFEVPAHIGERGPPSVFTRRETGLLGDVTTYSPRTAAIEKAIANENEVRASFLRSRDAAAAFNLTVAEAAARSNDLSRHGALSTEFIQSFAKGEVSLREFGNAVTSTIGKFAGWAVAGAAVFGAYELIKRGIDGATTASNGFEQLRRAIPGADRQQAIEGFRDVSARINVAPKDVAEAQFFAARAGFHGQDESLKAGETALLAHKLDEVPIQEATRGLGALHAAFGLNAEGIREIFNILDVGQLKFNARLNQTLPQIARSASAVSLAGGSPKELAQQIIEIFSLTGGGGGQGGGSPATAFIREASGNLLKAQSQKVLRENGFNPQKAQENVTKFNSEVQDKVAKGELNAQQIRDLANAAGGGGALGGRYFTALFSAANTKQVRNISSSDQAQEDLNHKLAQFDEQISSIGRGFERIGLEVGSSGLINVAGVVVSSVKIIEGAFERLLKPLGSVGALLNDIPGGATALAVGGGALLATRFARSERGLGLSRTFGEVPGVGGLFDTKSKRDLQQLQRFASEGFNDISDRARGQSRVLQTAGTDQLIAARQKREFEASARGQQFLSLEDKDRTDKAKALRKEAALYEENLVRAEQRTAKEAELLNQLTAIEQEFVARKKLLYDKSLSVQARVNAAGERREVAGEAGGLFPPGVLRGPYGAVGSTARAQAGAARESGLIFPATFEASRKAEAEGRLKSAEADTAAAAATRTASAETVAGFAATRQAATQLSASMKAAAESAIALDAANLRTAATETGRNALGLGGAALSGATKGLGSKALGAFLVVSLTEIISEALGGLAHKVFGAGAGSAVSGLGKDVAYGAGIGTLFGSPVAGGVAGAAYFGASALLDEERKSKEEKAIEPDILKTPIIGKILEFDRKLPILGHFVGGRLSGEEDAKRKQFREEQVARVRLAAKSRTFLRDTGESVTEQAQLEAQAYLELTEQAQKPGKEGESAQKQLESRNNQLAQAVKLYSGTGQSQKFQGQAAAQAAQQLAALSRNPDNPLYAQGAEKALQAGLKPAEELVNRQLKSARSQADIASAYANYEKEAGGAQKLVTQARADLQGKQKQQLEEAKQNDANANRAAVKGEGGRAKDLREKANQLKKEAGETGKYEKTLGEIGPNIVSQVEEARQQAGERAFQAAQKLLAQEFSPRIARAGRNTAERRKLEEAKVKTSEEQNRQYNSASPEAFRAQQSQITAERIALQQAARQERVERTEQAGALRLAQLPLGATKVSQAQIKLATAERVAQQTEQGARSGAFGQKEVVDAKIKLLEARKSLEEAQLGEEAELDKLKTRLAQAQATGNRSLQANLAVGEARRGLARARTPAQRLEAQTALVEAQNQRQQAYQQTLQDEEALLESRTTSPLQQARIKVRFDRKLLATATPDERIRLLAQQNRDRQAVIGATISESEERIDSQKQLGQISNQTAIGEYQKLLRLKGLSAQQRRQILLAIHGLQDELGVGNNGTYDLAPGNIKLPTAYDVHRAIGNYKAPSSLLVADASTRIDNHANIYITVHNAKDVHRVADALDRHYHSGVKARLKATGHRGT